MGLSPRHVFAHPVDRVHARVQATEWGHCFLRGAVESPACPATPAWAFIPSASVMTSPALSGPSPSLLAFSERGSVARVCHCS